MARPKTPENILIYIFEQIQAGAKPQAIVDGVAASFEGYLISKSLVADMKNGWTHTDLGVKFGIAAKERKPKAAKPLEVAEVAEADELQVA